MAEKVVIISEGKVKTSNDKDWIELKDSEGKTHRVFQSVQGEDGEWAHLENEVSMLKAKIEDGTINNLPLKLGKEKKGQYWNVVSVELVKDALEKEAIEKLKPKIDSPNRGYALRYATDIAVAKIMMGGDMSTLKVIDVAKTFEMYLDGIEFEGKGE